MVLPSPGALFRGNVWVCVKTNLPIKMYIFWSQVAVWAATDIKQMSFSSSTHKG